MSPKKKNRKSRKAQVSPKATDPSFLEEKIREKLAAGKSQTALKLAKALAKAHPGPLAEELLRRALGSRIETLFREGKAREAGDLLNFAEATLPEREDWLLLRKSLALRDGQAEEFLESWLDSNLSPPEEETFRELVRKNLVDPRVLSRLDGPQEGSSFLQEARAVARAFEEAAEGPLSPEVREGLRVVGRRSPLASWRGVILGLAAFHEGKDEEARIHLQRVSADSAPAPLASLLLSLLPGGPSPRPFLEVPACAVLLSRMTSWNPFLNDRVRKLEKAVEQWCEKKTLSALRDIFRFLGQRAPALGLRLLEWMLVARNDWADPLFFLELRAAALDHLPRKEVHLVFSRSIRIYPILRFHSLMCWLVGEEGRDPFPLSSDQELSAILEWAAPLAQEFEEEVAFDWADQLLEEFTMDPDDPEPLLKELSDFCCVEEGNWDPEFQVLAAALRLQRALFSRIRERTGKERRKGRLRSVFEGGAQDLNPREEHYRIRLRAMRKEGGPPGRIRGLLSDWRSDFPESVEALIESAKEEIRRGAHRKALALIQEARRLRRGDREARRLFLRLYLARVTRHYRNGKAHLLEKDLSEMREVFGEERGPGRIFLAAAECLLAELESEDPGAALAGLESLAGGAQEAREVLALARAVSGSPLGPSGAEAAGDDPAGETASLLRLLETARAWDPRYVRFVKYRMRSGHPGPGDMPEGEADLLVLCEFADSRKIPELLHVASGKGLLRGGALLPRFLMYRWISLAPFLPPREERALKAAVRFYQKRFPDQVVEERLAVSAKREVEITRSGAENVLRRERERQLPLRERVSLDGRRGRSSSGEAGGAQAFLF